jgi:hypothetical protein
MKHIKIQGKPINGGSLGLELREKLKEAIVDTFQQELQTLSPEFQSMLIDDLVTAFYNRFTILKKNSMMRK